MFCPWFTPLKTQSGFSGINASTASITQSVGVPSTCQRRSARCTGRSGWCSVSEWLVALCSRSGATTYTSPSGSAASARHSMPCARMPSSLVIRNRMNDSLLFVGGEQSYQLLQLVLQRIERLHGERRTCDRSQLSTLAMLVDFLTRALDGVLLGVQQMLDEVDQLDLAALVDAVAGAVLRRIEKAELALPVAQHVRLEVGQLTHLADAEELLDGFGGHASCSARSSRVMSSLMARRAGYPSKRMRCTVATIGISTPSRAASACALRVVVTPSAMVSFPASASASVAPRPTS